MAKGKKLPNTAKTSKVQQNAFKKPKTLKNVLNTQEFVRSLKPLAIS
jgi:hypothetical protein